MQSVAATRGASGVCSFVFIGNADLNSANPQIRVFFFGSDTIVQFDLGGDSDTDVDFEIELAGNILLTQNDFAL